MIDKEPNTRTIRVSNEAYDFFDKSALRASEKFSQIVDRKLKELKEKIHALENHIERLEAMK